MKIGILGTGMVGQTIGDTLIQLGHDVSNPLDFSRGMPPTLFVCNTDSLGEQIQQRFPDTRVVKAFNTLTAYLMVNPAKLPDDHDLIISCSGS